MSPRSEELFAAARQRLAAAHDVHDPSTALSAAYYAMLYAARAALSERDVYAKTHKGTWLELRRVFVESGDLDAGLVTAVQRTQPAREHADYDAWTPTRDEVDAAIELADRFIETIGNLFD